MIILIITVLLTIQLLTEYDVEVVNELRVYTYYYFTPALPCYDACKLEACANVSTCSPTPSAPAHFSSNARL